MRRGKLPASSESLEAEAVLLNKIIQHLVVREGILVVASTPAQVGAVLCRGAGAAGAGAGACTACLPCWCRPRSAAELGAIGTPAAGAAAAPAETLLALWAWVGGRG